MKNNHRQGLKIFVNFALSMFFSMVLTILPLPHSLLWFHPSWILMALVFWLVFFPSYVNLFVCWTIGLLTDILTGTLMGQNAFLFVIIGYILLGFLNRFIYFSLWRQCLTWVLLSFVVMFFTYCINAFTGNTTFHIVYLSEFVLNPLIWPVMLSVLLHFYRPLINNNQYK